ncbi:MAG TPA: hypothetical protein VFJ82_03120 [Longimicrobium sp.]|nr:hypothetical protein [Longimicrobium sp.]
MRRCSTCRSGTGVYGRAALHVSPSSTRPAAASTPPSVSLLTRTRKRGCGGRKRGSLLGPTGSPVSTRARATRKENRCGFGSFPPSIALKLLPMVTVYSRPASSGRSGVKRMVTGSRHSTLPAAEGEMRNTRSASTMSSSPPATGRSKVTVTGACGSAYSSARGSVRRMPNSGTRGWTARAERNAKNPVITRIANSA